MLEHFCIFAKGGILLWSIQFTALKGTPLEELIRTVLLEERSGERSFAYSHGNTHYTLKWTYHNEIGLVFVAVYQQILQLLYVDELLEKVKEEFVPLYKERKYDYESFGATFKQLQAAAESKSSAGGRSNGGPGVAKRSKEGVKPDDDEEGDEEDDDSAVDAGSSMEDLTQLGEAAEGDSASAATAFNISKLKKRGAKGKKQQEGDQLKSAKEPTGGKEPVGKKKGKTSSRQWYHGPEGGKLDFSESARGNSEGAAAPPKREDMGKSGVDDEDDFEYDDDDDEGEEAVKSKAGGGSWFSSVLRNVVGKESLERSDVQPVLDQLKVRLMAKNVAEVIVEKLCESIATSLEGQKMSSFTRISTVVRSAMEDALTRILTPQRSTNILREIDMKREKGSPYVIVFIGVNGVGKSTNLSKVCYWLLQHEKKVLIAACDTFRSGAVEQLRTHCTRLDVPLFERGYEKDPAAVASEAILQAKRDGTDVVLVDTAGRMQDNEPLMRALSKLINTNNPDLTLFVGEALVGNDAVDQLTKFNERLADLSSKPGSRMIDGIVLTKFDTIDDKVGAALSMVYTSGAPIMFVGMGQTYTDLRKLNVKQIVHTLLK
mmetsp:Transcript_1717/g.6043  ORF Transcript_1717/g.6043 Transcript_1717/m.6043 type:complete len:602 (+) Transcript_1717:193-1998(+)